MSTQLFGIHAVQAALDYSPQKIQRAWVDGQRQDVRLKQVIDDLASLGIFPEKTDRKKLDKLADGKNHQGIIVAVELPAMRSEEQLKQDVEALTATPFYLVLDQVQDPHNLGLVYVQPMPSVCMALSLPRIMQPALPRLFAKSPVAPQKQSLSIKSPIWPGYCAG